MFHGAARVSAFVQQRSGTNLASVGTFMIFLAIFCIDKEQQLNNKPTHTTLLDLVSIQLGLFWSKKGLYFSTLYLGPMPFKFGTNYGIMAS